LFKPTEWRFRGEKFRPARDDRGPERPAIFTQHAIAG
jgi:hypothetical protein